MQSDLYQLKEKVLATALAAYRRQLSVGTSGNVSALYRPNNWVVITPSGYDYELMQPDDIVVIDLDGNKVEGELAPSSEWRMHSEIYKALPHVGAVVHTHSPYATGFAVLRQEIPVVLIEMLPFIKGSLEVCPYAEQGSADVGLKAVPILQNKNACLMANHGAVAVGEDLNSAYTNAVYTEDVAKIYHLALSVGRPFTIEE